MPRPLERPEDRCALEAGAQFGLITRQRARELGMSDSAIARRVSRGAWRSVGGVLLVPGFAHSWYQRVMLAVLRGGRDAVASHRTAAALLGLEGVAQGCVEIYAPTLKGDDELRVHRTKSLPACDVTKVGSIPVTSVSRTLVDLGAVADESVVEMALECALRRGWTSIPRLRWRLEQVGGRGRRGSATLRRLLDRRDVSMRPTQSVLEVKLDRALRRTGLPRPVRQHSVVTRTGRRRFIDFAWPHCRLGVEVGGRAYHAGPAAAQRDSRRHNELAACGWTILYFTWDDVDYRLGYVLDCIGSELHPRLG